MTDRWDVLKELVDRLFAVLSNWWFWVFVVAVLVGTGVVDGHRIEALTDKAIQVIRSVKS